MLFIALIEIVFVPVHGQLLKLQTEVFRNLKKKGSRSLNFVFGCMGSNNFEISIVI